MLCSEDCSTKARVKDSHDNYYCKACHEAAEQQNGRANGVNKPPVEEAIPLAAASDDDDGPAAIIQSGQPGDGLGLSLDDSDPGFDSFVPDSAPQPHVVKAGAPAAADTDDDLVIMDTSTTLVDADDDDDLQLDMSDSFAAI